MVRALEELREAGKDSVRDSDVKRKMLEMDARFDETELGFPKFSKFLAQAEEHGVVRLVRNEAGNFEVTLDGAGEQPKPKREGRRRGGPARTEPDEAPSLFGAFGAEPGSEETAPPMEAPPAPRPKPEPKVEPKPTVLEINPAEFGDTGLRLGPRRGSTRRRGDEALVLLPGQAVTSPSARAERPVRSPEPTPDAPAAPAAPTAPTAPTGDGALDAEALGLPIEPAAIVRYLTHRYRGVGEKTAEALVERFGPDLFRVLKEDPDAIAAAVTPKRAEQVLEAWKIDFERRSGRRGGGSSGGGDAPEARSGSSDRSRRGGRRRGPRGRGAS
jgi:hypothetical protein